VQGCGVRPGGVTWPDWAQCVSEAWAHACLYKISTRFDLPVSAWPVCGHVMSTLGVSSAIGCTCSTQPDAVPKTRTHMQIGSQTMLLCHVCGLVVVCMAHCKTEWPCFAHICITDTSNCVLSRLAVS